MEELSSNENLFDKTILSVVNLFALYYLLISDNWIENFIKGLQFRII